MMEEKAWSKLHLSLRGPQPCEKNTLECLKISEKFAHFCFHHSFPSWWWRRRLGLNSFSHWEALNLVKRIQNQCNGASECLDMSEYFAIFFFHHPLPGCERKDNPNCISPKWCYLHISPPSKNRTSQMLLLLHSGPKPCHLKEGRRRVQIPLNFPDLKRNASLWRGNDF